MGLWKQFFDAFEKEYRLLNGEHPVDKYECKRREERRRARELEWQRNHVYLCLPKWWEKKYKNRPDELRSAVFKLKDVDLKDYKGPDFSESSKSSSLVTYTPGYCAHPVDGGRRCLAHSYPTIKRNYDQEDAEAHERYVDSVCSAARVGRILRMVEDARFEAKRHH